MSAIGGSIAALDLAGRNFAVAADADISQSLGGDVNDVQANGDGTVRPIKTVTPWKLEGLNVSIDDSNQDFEYLQDLADRNGLFPLAVTLASGVIYQGTGQITGDLVRSTNSATATVNLEGQGKLTQQ